MQIVITNHIQKDVQNPLTHANIDTHTDTDTETHTHTPTQIHTKKNCVGAKGYTTRAFTSASWLTSYKCKCKVIRPQIKSLADKVMKFTGEQLQFKVEFASALELVNQLAMYYTCTMAAIHIKGTAKVRCTTGTIFTSCIKQVNMALHIHLVVN